MNCKTLATFLVVFAFAFFARAHDPGLSTLQIQRDGEQLRATLLFAPSDLQSIAPIDQNSDGTISPQEFSAAQDILGKLAGNLLEVSLDENPLPVLEAKCAQDTNDNFWFEMTFAPSPGVFLKVVSKWLDVLQPGHRQFVSFKEGNATPITEDLLDADNNTFTTELAPPTKSTKTETENPAASATRKISFAEFFRLGIHHIWTGYDHLLFLFALLIVCDSFGSIAKIVTCFTLAHSLTLALATLNIVTIPSRVIEPAIAASIVYVGLENIFRDGHPKGRWLLTFTFGLVHGFGFASVLREMEIAKAGSVVVPLVSFNLGVEFGQIVVAAILLPAIWWLKKQPKFAPRWVPACSALVAAAGAFWFVQRVWF